MINVSHISYFMLYTQQQIAQYVYVRMCEECVYIMHMVHRVHVYHVSGDVVYVHFCTHTKIKVLVSQA